jgi:small-conductance mechanosensitive channel
MIAEIIVIVITTSVALAIYGVDLVSIVTGLGLLTTGLSLGAKNIINQFLSGIILLAERPFVKGDKINKKGYFAAEVADPEGCIACGTCARVCPDVCISVYKDVE